MQAWTWQDNNCPSWPYFTWSSLTSTQGHWSGCSVIHRCLMRADSRIWQHVGESSHQLCLISIVSIRIVNRDPQSQVLPLVIQMKHGDVFLAANTQTTSFKLSFIEKYVVFLLKRNHQAAMMQSLSAPVWIICWPVWACFLGTDWYQWAVYLVQAAFVEV